MTKTKNPLAWPAETGAQLRAMPRAEHSAWIRRLLLVTIDQYLTCIEHGSPENEQIAGLDRVLARAEELIRRSF